MIRAGSGPGGSPANGPGTASWLVSLADLSLILFIVTGGAIAANPGENPAEAEQEPGAPAMGVADQVYIDGPGGPPLAMFLAQHQPAGGEQLTITGTFAPGARQAVVQRVEALAAEASAAGIEPRVIVQPAAQSGVVVLFAHDGDPQLAQGLRNAEQQSGP
ncbi:MAG: hypothetical protein KDE15_00175 [Erythrobacter sp.]|nr:hypothetical protein [Erythrobacter sp.]